jgi:hypothetical protein
LANFENRPYRLEKTNQFASVSHGVVPEDDELFAMPDVAVLTLIWTSEATGVQYKTHLKSEAIEAFR